MTTSLAQQLQRLAVPQTSLYADNTKRASLLFDPKDVAGFRRDTIYYIGLEGLEDLISKNSQFTEFKHSLFHESSKEFDRAIQTKEMNKKLDVVIKRFLTLLSPYFMLSSAHKALEWLLNRYMVNEFNREDMLMLIIPYHETNIFVKAVQTLKFNDDNDAFYFLKSLQKPGVHLTKQNLLQHAASNPGFLKFVTKIINNLLEVHKNNNLLTIHFNFYCTIFTGTIEYSNEIAEDQMSQLLPLVLKGLNSDIPDYAAASYVITSRLLTKTTLSDKLLNKIINKLCDVKNENLKFEVTLVILLVYQFQKQYTTIPSQVVVKLAKYGWFVECLQHFNSEGDYIYSFLKVLVAKATEEALSGSEDAKNLINSILKQMKFDDFFVEEFLCCILDAVEEQAKYSNEIRQWLCEVVQTLDTQYSTVFDDVICKILNDKNTQNHRKIQLKKILENTITYKGKLEFFNKLYHPNQKIREEVMVYLTKNFTKLKASEQELFKNSVFDRINDNSPEVAEKALDFLNQTDILNHDLYDNELINLIRNNKMASIKWKHVLTLTINLLINNREFNCKIFLSLFPYIISYSKIHLKQILKILNSNFFAKLCNFNLTKITNTNELLNSFLTCFEENRDLDLTNEFQKILTDLSSDSLTQYSAFLVLSHLIPEQCPVVRSSSILQHFHNIYGSLKADIVTEESDILTYIGLFENSKFPLKAWHNCIQMVILKTAALKTSLDLIDLHSKTDNSEYVKVLVSSLFNENFNKDLADTCLRKVCNNSSGYLNFILNISASDVLSNDYVIRILNFISSDIKIENNGMVFDLTSLAYLLALLTNINSKIRKGTMKIIQNKVKKSPNDIASFLPLLQEIILVKEEIIIDQEQVASSVYNIFMTKDKTEKINGILNKLVNIGVTPETPTCLKAKLLIILSRINNFQIFEKFCSIAIDLLKELTVIDQYNAIICKKLIEKLNRYSASEVSINSNVWKFIEYALKCETKIISDNQEQCLSSMVLNQLSRDVYCGFSEGIFQKILDVIVEASVTITDPEVSLLANRFFKHLDLNAKLILPLLDRMVEIKSTKVDQSKKKNRLSSVPTIDILDTLEWKKGVSAIEFIQDKKKLRNSDSLLPLLFKILKKCLDFEQQDLVEYPKQLLLSLILLISEKINNQDILKNLFNIELVVQCIRASQNPQTHHHALLVLVNAAQYVPTEVLHHIMTIFTFMGSSLLRYDDVYSFQIISKIIDAIIPILLKDKNTNNITMVLRVFVDALLDVPEHRRATLYKQLLNRINEDEHLYLFLLLVFERQVLHEKQKNDKSATGSRRLEIASNLCQEFSVEVILRSFYELIKYLKALPNEKDDFKVTDDKFGVFNMKNYTEKQFRHFKYTLITFIRTLLTSQQFINKIVILTDQEASNLEGLYKELIVIVLTHIQTLQRVTENASSTPQAKYWKVMLHYSYDILDNINALLSPHMFILVIKGLMLHNLRTVKKRALELLISKLQHNSQYFSNCEIDDIYVLMPPIIGIIQTLNSEQLETEQEVLIQTALLSVKLLVKSLAANHSDKFISVLEFISSIFTSGKAQNNVLASVLLCLAELVANLKMHAISSLPDFMPTFLKLLKHQKHEDTLNLTLLSVVTAVSKLLDSLPLFLRPYLQKILVEISILMSKWKNTTNDQKLLPLVNKLSTIKQKISSVIPSRILIPAIESSYNILVQKKYYKAIGALMEILSNCFQNLNANDITSNLQELMNFFLQMLKFRSENETSIDDANLVETNIVKSLTVLILKLSENSFRPFYYKIYEWAIIDGERSERLITFYNFSMNIAESLKGLFVLFAGHFLNNAAQILSSINTLKKDYSYFDNEEKNILLLENVLKTLERVFNYDNQKFINRERFDLLMQPLADQLENTLGGVTALTNRNEQLLTPAIVNFLAAVSDDICWKQMNYQILLKMRSNSSDIRLISLHCIRQVVGKLGQEFIPLLPETIPFLAELLEDEEEKVEKACNKAIHEMENVLGEPLQKYF